MLRACGYLGGVVTRLAEANSRCCSPSSPLNVAATLAAAKTKGSHATLFTTPLPVRVPSASIFNTTTTADTESAQKEGVQHQAHPTRALIELIRENEGLNATKLWKEVQNQQEQSEGLRAIPSKKQMKLLLHFMKKTFKVKTEKDRKRFVYKLHPMLLRKEEKLQQK